MLPRTAMPRALCQQPEGRFIPPRDIGEISPLADLRDAHRLSSRLRARTPLDAEVAAVAQATSSCR